MTLNLRDDVQLTRQQIQSLPSADRLAAFFATLRYPDDARLAMTAEALQLNATLTNATRRVERLTSVAGGALQVFLWHIGGRCPVQSLVLKQDSRLELMINKGNVIYMHETQ